MKDPLCALPFPENCPLYRHIRKIGTRYGREVAGHERLDPGNVLQPQGGVIASLLSTEVRKMLAACLWSTWVAGSPGSDGTTGWDPDCEASNSRIAAVELASSS